MVCRIKKKYGKMVSQTENWTMKVRGWKERGEKKRGRDSYYRYTGSGNKEPGPPDHNHGSQLLGSRDSVYSLAVSGM